MRQLLCFTGVTLVVFLAGTSAQAGFITDTFQFNHLSTDRSVVTGSFTYDNSGPNPFAVTTITVDDTSFPISLTETAPALTFDGTSLNGSFAASGDVFIFGIDGAGSFAGSPAGPTGSLGFEVLLFGFIPVGFDSVSGPMTIMGASSAVPEPSSLALCTVAGAIGLAVARVRRKRAV
jgi:hypothetical protein